MTVEMEIHALAERIYNTARKELDGYMNTQVRRSLSTDDFNEVSLRTLDTIVAAYALGVAAGGV